MTRPIATRGFTLIELLVVIAIIAVLISILLPALSSARFTSRVVACQANQRSIGQAIFTYANDYNDSIPFGPKAPEATVTSFYPITGFVTSLLTISDGSPVGLGLLLDPYLAELPETLFCPGTDDDTVTDAQLEFVGKGQAQASYWYRHGSATRYIQNPSGGELIQNQHTRLDQLGDNPNGDAITALVMDTNFIVDPALAFFGVVTITHHDTKRANVLHADGSSITRDNDDAGFSADVGTLVHFGPSRILDAFEAGDAAFGG